MPKVRVEIDWDKPDDPGWLNPLNIKLCLEAYCKNTKFGVRDLGTGVTTEEEKDGDS